MENTNRSPRGRRGGWERTHDQQRGQNFRGTEGGQQGRSHQNESYRGAQTKGRQGLLGAFPGDVRGGPSPLLKEDYRWHSGFDNSGGNREHNKRERLNWRANPQVDSPREDSEASDSGPHIPGKKRRNRNNRTLFSEMSSEAVINEPTTKVDRRDRQAERRLKRDGIHPLTKMSNSHPNAVYTCFVCEVFMDSVADAYRHIFRDKRHKKKMRERQEREMLTKITPPSAEQISAISAALEDVGENGITDQDVETRQNVVTVMQDLLLSVLPGITLRLYGSSCTKFGFKDSDVNIDIQFPAQMHQPKVLLLVKECLSVSPLYDDLEADFHARVPVVVCREKKSGLICKVSAGNDNAFQTTSYLSALVSQEPVLLPLVLGLRRWAQICQIDRPEEGGLPPYIFALMVVYFLQQRKEPLLPTYLNHETKVFSVSRLPDFSLTHVEDGHIHWLYTPSSKDLSQSTDKPSLTGKVPLVLQHPHPSVDVGLLWVEILRFYSVDFNIEDSVISVRTKVVLSREMKDWPKNRIAVEDPFAVKRNVARSVNSQQVYDYIIHCLKTTYMYFALPPKKTSARKTKAIPEGTNTAHEREDLFSLPESSDLIIEPKHVNTPKTEDNGPEDSDCIIEEELEEDSDSEKDKEKNDLGKGSLSEDEEDDDLEQDESHPQVRQHLDSLTTDEELFPLEEIVTTEDEELFPLEEISAEELLSDEEGPDLDPTGLVDEAEEQLVDDEQENKHKKDLSYKFTKQAFTRGKSHLVVCTLCKRDGHLKKDCPEDFKKVQLDPLPPMLPDFLSVLDHVCEQCHADFAPGELEERVRDHILQDLQMFVRRQFAGAKLQLFGSSKNGFGFRQSDLDICMMLEGQENINDDDCISIIESLARLMKKHSGLKNILPITTAKVPIVKFCHVQTGLEGDISLYNTLALHNTNLLASYAAIDRRVKILCYVMKVFAKMCDIGDASRGSLSSYAYTLMVLFYLQQRNPPVIPVLQEIHDGKKPEVLVDGWNVYFFDNMAALPSWWTHYGKNTESVGELWLGLLRFYTEDFDFREHVVCIRQHARLTTFNKQWTSKYIAIEDPFDLNHNLGAGLSRKMINFIMKAFINSRKVFGTPITVIPVQYPSTMEYFFDPEVLTEGEVAPNDRCCRICGKIGHFMKDCPMKKKSRHRHDSEKRSDVQRTDEGSTNEHWRRRDALETRCCFLCGSTTHMKRDCQQYRGPAGNVKVDGYPSPSGPFRAFRGRDRNGSPLQENKKQQVILSPQAGSLASRNMGRPRKGPVE